MVGKRRSGWASQCRSREPCVSTLAPIARTHKGTAPSWSSHTSSGKADSLRGVVIVIDTGLVVAQ